MPGFYDTLQSEFSKQTILIELEVSQKCLRSNSTQGAFEHASARDVLVFPALNPYRLSGSSEVYWRLRTT